ncbi:ATP synthase subunit b 1 [Hypericibacter terrae]|uniref:ATP synthase subunit b n=1 Tax=Hypericibacter terrae TaxID=2602015 RepID=A0A5J6MET5_9PROT|nr:F0F1 ATP synthase subunit B [Hypericibacter terrae]QEX15527.1 ATP synthase subunit b 1 [Hypericibacter terrae]
MEFLHEPEFWVAIAFVIFIVLAGKPIYRAIGKMLDDRAAKIRKDLGEAEKLRNEAEKLLAEYQRRQRQALKEADAILAQAKDEAERIRKSSAANIETALKRRERQALEKIAQAETLAVAEVRNQAVNLAVLGAQKALASGLDPARAGSLIDQSVADLERRLH